MCDCKKRKHQQKKRPECRLVRVVKVYKCRPKRKHHDCRKDDF